MPIRRIPSQTQAGTFRDKVATVDKEGKRIWVFPQKPKGKLYNARTWLSILYLAVFFALPFVHVNGHPVFLINILERKFILFGQIFWPQDFFIFRLLDPTSFISPSKFSGFSTSSLSW